MWSTGTDHRVSECMSSKMWPPSFQGPLHQWGSNASQVLLPPGLGSSRCHSSAALVGHAAAWGSESHSFMVLILPESSRTNLFSPPSGLSFLFCWHIPSGRTLCGLLEKGGHVNLPIQSKTACIYELFYIYVWEGSTIGGCKTTLEFGHMFIHIIFVPDSNLSLAEMKTSSCR